MMRRHLLTGVVVALLAISLIGVVVWARSGTETATGPSDQPVMPETLDVAPPGDPSPAPTTPTAPPTLEPTPVVPDPVTAAPTPARNWSAAAEATPTRTPGRSTARPTPARGGSGSGEARLRIPSLAVDARIAPAAIRDGVFQVPADPAVVGVNRGPATGLPARLAPSPGTILMSGHVTSGATRGALWPLHKLAPGSELETSDGAGATTRWRATRLRTVPADQLPADLLDRAGPTRLVLVTCAGEVETVDGRRRYRDNLLVEAVPVG